MSLLDDVSIVVTPNGYKAGELYAVVPVPVEGSEEITNGDFSSSTGWSFTNSGGSNGWRIDAGRAICDTVASSTNRNLNSTFSIVNGKSYRLIIDILQSEDNMSILVGSTQLSETLPTGTHLNYEYFIPESVHSGGTFTIFGGSSDLQEIDNVSVKEYTAADMDVTRATAATRVDEAGLVNFAEIVSDTELVTNGDFATDTDWTKGTGWTISGGNLNASNVNAVSTEQPGYTFVGKTFQVSYTISDYSQGSVQVYLGGAQSTSLKSANGTHTEIISISSGNTILYIYGISNFTGNIDNVSVKEVTRDNVPRIDYTGGGCPHILAEPQRTNLLTYSEDFSNAIWQKQTGIVPTYNTTETLSPDGTNNATKFIGTGSTGVFKSSVSVSGNLSRSVYLKSVSGTTTAKFKDPNATGGAIPVNLTITNEWQRFELTGDNGTAFQGLWIDDITSDGLYMWGAQLESGSFPTSYIPTSGSTVTRNQDQFTRDGIGSLINDSEGTLYFEGSALENGGGSHRIISLSDGTSNNLIYIRVDSTASRFRGFARGSSGSYTLITVNSVPQTDNNKIALVWDATNFRIWINGSERATAIINDLPVGMNTLNLTDPTSSDPFFGKVRQLQVYTEALSDTQLAALTS